MGRRSKGTMGGEDVSPASGPISLFLEKGRGLSRRCHPLVTSMAHYSLLQKMGDRRFCDSGVGGLTGVGTRQRRCSGKRSEEKGKGRDWEIRICLKTRFGLISSPCPGPGWLGPPLRLG